ncbi:MAG TPA: hypothetical protein VHB99_01995, partial [Pirellulales bacterium]|nr:hypothetical protein [Pirellulales bacterium]
EPAAVRPRVAAAPAAPASQATIRVVPQKRARKSAVIRSQPAAEEAEETTFETRDSRPEAENDKTVLRLTSAEQTSPPAVKPAKSPKAAGLSVRHTAEQQNIEPRIIEPLKTAHVSAPKASEIMFAPPAHPATKSPAKRSQQPAEDSNGDSWVLVGD